VFNTSCFFNASGLNLILLVSRRSRVRAALIAFNHWLWIHKALCILSGPSITLPLRRFHYSYLKQMPWFRMHLFTITSICLLFPSHVPCPRTLAPTLLYLFSFSHGDQDLTDSAPKKIAHRLRAEAKQQPCNIWGTLPPDEFSSPLPPLSLLLLSVEWGKVIHSHAYCSTWPLNPWPA
jgi:hypothetical protein